MRPRLDIAPLEPSLAVEGFALGSVVAVAAALVPIVEALRTVPREVLHPGWVERRRRIRAGRLAMAGLGWWALAWALAHAGPIHGIPLFGYGAALCLVLGGAFVTPLAGTWLGRVVDPLALRLGWVEARLAGGTLSASLPEGARAGARAPCALRRSPASGGLRRRDRWTSPCPPPSPPGR